MEFRRPKRSRFDRFVAAFTPTVSTSEKIQATTRFAVQRTGLAVAVSILGLAMPASEAQAAPPRHTMKVFVARGDKAVASGQETSASGPQYGLFSCQVAGAASAANCIDPYEMRHAYQIDSLIAEGYDGRGQTIVIVDAFQNPSLVAQMTTFDNFYGLPPVQLAQVAPDGLTPFDPTNGEMTGWAQEISLDVEWAHAIAPGARIVLVSAKSSNDPDILSAISYAVTNELGSVISMSFGENESCLSPQLTAAYHTVFAAATQKNITLFASSGDQGAAQGSCNGKSWVKAVSSPANDPLVTGVGGTELTVAKYCLVSTGCDPTKNPGAGTYIGETVWNEGLPYGDYGSLFGEGTAASGGGLSVVYGEPLYQRSTRLGKQRGVPDVAYSGAIEHGVLTYLAIPGIPSGFYLFGGTSAGAPQWAAIAAIADQRAGRSLGFLNTALYHLADGQQGYADLFHDITLGTNSSLQFDSLGNPVNIVGFAAYPGWDAATGFGSPKVPGLVDALVQYVGPGDGAAVVASTKMNATVDATARTAARTKVTPH